MARVVKCDQCTEVVNDDLGQAYIEVEFHNWNPTLNDPGASKQFCSIECVGKYFAPDVPF